MRKALSLPGARTKPGKTAERTAERKFLQAARAHFAKDFPNPKRMGCPPTSQLKQLADRPGAADESVLNHVSFCSPCYRAFSRFLQTDKKKMRARTQRVA